MTERADGGVGGGHAFFDRLNRISAAAREIGSSLDPDVVTDRALGELVQLFDIEAAFLMLAEPNGGMLRTEGYAGVGKEHLGALDVSQNDGVCARAFQSGETVFLPSVHDHRNPHFSEKVKAAGLSDLWLLPLASRGERLGVLGLFLGLVREAQHTGEEDALGEWERNLIYLFAQHVAAAFQNARFHDESLSRLGLTKTVVEHLPSAIALVSSDSLRIVEANARLQRLVACPAVTGRLAAEVLEPLLSRLDEHSTADVINAVIEEGRRRTFSAVPIGSSIGGERFWDVAFNPVVILSSGPAYVLVSAIEVTEQVNLRKRLEGVASEERRRSSQLIILNQLAVTLNSEADAGRMLDDVLRGATHITGATGGAFYLTEESGELRLEAFISVPESAHGADDPRPGRLSVRSLAERAIVERRLLRLSEEIADDPGAFRGYLAVPLITAEGDVLGGFVLTGASTEHGFSAEHEMLASTLGAHVTVALQNLMQLHNEQETAAYLQRALLPRVTDVPGVKADATYESATETTFVGGDFYDVFVRVDGKVCLIVGDVCGKGLSAATHMAMVRHTVRAYSSLKLTAGEWLRLVNENVESITDAGFATAVLVLLNPKTGEIDYALAGHPSPLLIADESVCELGGARGLPLGIDPTETYESQSMRVEPGDRIILFTDGLYEARREGELFGAYGLHKAASKEGHGELDGAAERLVGAARDFAGGHLSDDVVVVVAEVILDAQV